MKILLFLNEYKKCCKNEKLTSLKPLELEFYEAPLETHTVRVASQNSLKLVRAVRKFVNSINLEMKCGWMQIL